MNQTASSLERRAIFLIVLFTLIAAIAQPLFKIGANDLAANLTVGGVLTDFPLIGGLALYGFGSIVMIGRCVMANSPSSIR